MRGTSKEHRQGLHIDTDGYEGPMHLLLELARKQKIDLLQISILDLVEQYLAFIRQSRQIRLDTAADYLVMAAWLTYLKSRLLLPEKADENEEGMHSDELAEQLRQRLIRLEAMRKAAGELMELKQLGIHVFRRGMPESVRCIRSSIWEANLHDLLKAYAWHQEKKQTRVMRVNKRKTWSLKQARERLELMLGSITMQNANEWHTLDNYLLQFLANEKEYRTALASSFGASLEMARDADLELRQSEAFGPIYFRQKPVNKTGKTD